MKKKNVVMFVMDDQSPDETIHAIDGNDIITPTLDNLVKEGTYLRPYTTVPVCTPGRAELLTGVYAFRNGCRWFGEPIKRDIKQLAEVLADSGYHTVHIGKWHNDGHPRHRGSKETHTVFEDDLLEDAPGRQYWAFMEQGERLEGHSTEIFCQQAIQFLDKKPTEKPWYCYVALTSPHDPRICPEPWQSMYYDENLPSLPENYMPEHPFDNGDMMIRDELLAPFPRKQKDILKHRADYYGMISHHDHYIGKVLNKLKETGQYEETIIIFTSDHGLAVGRHGLMGKENLYEHSARVPLIISGPNIPKNLRVDKQCLCGHYDFMPTIFDLLELDTPDSCEGISYIDVLNTRGKIQTIRKYAFAGYRDCMRMARNKDYKMIYYPGVDKVQLFNITEDPEELNDLMQEWRRDRFAPFEDKVLGGTGVETPEMPEFLPKIKREKADEIVKELFRELNSWQEEMDDPILEVCRRFND